MIFHNAWRDMAKPVRYPRASSGGLDHSPPTANMIGSLFDGYKFDNGTIYDRLDPAGVSWTIYEGDPFPQAMSIRGMIVRLAEGRFSDFEAFSSDVNNPGYATSFAFIAPACHVLSHFVCGTSQHPTDDILRAEGLITRLY